MKNLVSYSTAWNLMVMCSYWSLSKCELWLLAMSLQATLRCLSRQEVILQWDREVWLQFAPGLHFPKGSVFSLLVFQKSDKGMLAKGMVNRCRSGTVGCRVLSFMLKAFFLNICFANGPATSRKYLLIVSQMLSCFTCCTTFQSELLC